MLILKNKKYFNIFLRKKYFTSQYQIWTSSMEWQVDLESDFESS